MALLLVSAAEYQVADHLSLVRLEDTRSRAKAAGLSLTPDDLRRTGPAAKDNAASFYQTAFSELQSRPGMDAVIVNAYFLPPARKAEVFKKAGITAHIGDTAVARALAGYTPVFRAAEQAAAMPRLEWDRRWELGSAMASREGKPMGGFVLSLLVDADLAAKAGDQGRMLKRLSLASRVADQVGQNSDWYDLSLQKRLYRTIFEATSKIAYQRQSQSGVLKTLIQFLESLDPKVDYANAMRRQVVVDLVNVKRWAQHPEEIQISAGDPRIIALRIGPLARSYERWIIEQRLAAYRELSAVRDDIDATQAVMNRIQKSVDDMAPSYGFGALVPALPDHLAATDKEFRARLVLSIAFVKFLARHGGASWPASFVPLERDPFDGQPLRYRKASDGFVLYSLGRNKLDDGGKVGTWADVCVGVDRGQIVGID